MDSYLISCYRVVWNDLLLLYDASVFYLERRPTNKSLAEFAHGLQLLLRSEKDFLHYEEELVSDFTEDHFYNEALVEFMRGVVLEFIVEEVSQYPFWSTKVIALLTSASPGVKPSAASIISSAFKIYFERLRLGSGKIIAFYEGIVPYLGAAVIWNFGHLETEIHKYHSFMSSSMPRSLSSTSMLSTSTNSNTRKKQIASVSAPNSNSSNTNSRPLYVTAILSYCNRATLVLLAHPLLLLSLKSLTSHSSSIAVYFSLLSSGGLAALYSGSRLALTLALFPSSLVYAIGIPETLYYRRMMLGDGSGEFSGDRFGGSLRILKSILREEGWISLFGYGILTAVQVIPGFMSFASARMLLWLICGTSKQRLKLIRFREEILNNAWPKPPKPLPPTLKHQSGELVDRG